VPVIVLVGAVFYALGRPARRSAATEPVTAAYRSANPAP
jgi:hypothetical protein